VYTGHIYKISDMKFS